MNTVVNAGRRFGGKTADERRSGRRAQLIRAAVQIYGEKGYRNATVKAVCDAAGLTERYFYESFANSEDLLLACFRQVTADLFAAMRRAGELHGGAPVGRVRAGLLVYLKSLKDNPAGARVFLMEMASVSPRTEALVSENLEEFGALLLEFLQHDPTLNDRFSPLLLRGVIGGGQHIAQSWIASDYAEDIDVVADTALRLYLLVARD